VLRNQGKILGSAIYQQSPELSPGGLSPS